ncbi:MAG: type II secretion system F family protein [Kineosporiaceae bacterium]
MPPPPRAGGRRRAAAAVPGPVVLDLVAAVLRGGAPVATSLRAVAECLVSADAAGGEDLLLLADRHDLALDGPVEPVSSWAAVLDDALLVARDSGLAPGPVLTSAAADERRRDAARQRVDAARLGVRVVLPTGLCLLPAFVLLSVVPLVLALLGTSG